MHAAITVLSMPVLNIAVPGMSDPRPSTFCHGMLYKVSNKVYAHTMIIHNMYLTTATAAWECPHKYAVMLGPHECK